MKDKIWITPDHNQITIPEDVNPVFIFHMTLGYDEANQKEKAIRACTGNKFISFNQQNYPKEMLFTLDGLTIYFTKVQLDAINSYFTNGNEATK